MTQSTPTTVINVTARARGGLFYASSSDLFGLNIVASSEDQLKERLVKAVTWLYKQNHKMDVTVMFPSAPSEFPNKATASYDHLVIAAALAA